MDARIKKLAENLVNYSCKVKEGEKVYINYIGQETEDLARAIVKEVYKAKGKPFVHYISNEVLREILLNCDEEQMKLMAEIDALEMQNVAKIFIEKVYDVAYPNILEKEEYILD